MSAFVVIFNKFLMDFHAMSLPRAPLNLPPGRVRGERCGRCERWELVGALLTADAIADWAALALRAAAPRRRRTGSRPLRRCRLRSWLFRCALAREAGAAVDDRVLELDLRKGWVARLRGLGAGFG